jgi:hypothetical protein
MYRSLMVSAAALALVVPVLVSASANASDVSALDGSVLPAAISTTDTTTRAKEQPEIEALAVRQHQQARRPVPKISRTTVPKPSRMTMPHPSNPPIAKPRSFTSIDAGSKIKPGNHPSAADQVRKLQASRAEPKPTGRPLGKLGTNRPDPFTGQTNSQLQAKIDAAKQADKRVEDAKRLNMSPKVQEVLKNQAKEADAQAFAAQTELQRRNDEAKKTGDSTKPGGTIPGGSSGDSRPGGSPGDSRPGGGDDRPGKFGDRDKGDRPGSSFGDRGGRPAPDYAPGFTPQPRYSAQPSGKSRYISDEPVCVQGTWALQGGVKKYVCLSWHFRGQIYTPDQLEAVLAQLGRPRPALLGG